MKKPTFLVQHAPGAPQPENLNRRRFLKSTGGATLAAIIFASNGTTARVRASDEEPEGISWGEVEDEGISAAAACEHDWEITIQSEDDNYIWYEAKCRKCGAKKAGKVSKNVG